MVNKSKNSRRIATSSSATMTTSRALQQWWCPPFWAASACRNQAGSVVFWGGEPPLDGFFCRENMGFLIFFPDGFDLALPCSNHRNSFPRAFPTFNFDWVGEVIGMMSRSKANKWDLVYLVSRRVVMPLPEIGRFKRFKNQRLSWDVAASTAQSLATQYDDHWHPPIRWRMQVTKSWSGTVWGVGVQPIKTSWDSVLPLTMAHFPVLTGS